MSQDNRLLPVSAIDRTMDRPLSDFSASKPYGVSATEPTNIREYLFVVLKRKWLILSLVLVVTSLVTIQAFRAPSIYAGETTIRIEQKAPNVLQTKEIVIAGQGDPNFWGTQLKLLENPALARQVVLTLDLQHNPSFFGGQTQGGVFSSLRRIFAKPKKANDSPAVSPGLTVVGESEVTGGSLTPEQLAELEPYEDAIVAGELVEPVPTTNLVKIKFIHSDPELAQKIANTLAEVFVNNNLERSTEHSTKAEDQLAREIANLQTKIKHDQEVQFNYAKEKNLPLVNGTAGNLEATRLATLSGQLLQAQNDRKNLQAQLEAARKERDPFSVPDVNTSARVEKLRDRISALKETRDALLTTYTPEWPGVKKIEAQLQGLEAELDKAPSEIVTAMQRKYEAAVSQENLLRRSYEQQKGTTTQQTRDQIDLLAMTQELETNRQILNTLLQRQREFQVSNGDRSNEVSIATYSRLPREPIGPQRFRNIFIAFLLSLVAGIGLAFLLDFLDDTLKSVDDVDRYLHLPALALIPASRDRGRLIGIGGAATAAPNDTTALAMISDARSPVAESYRHLRTSLLLSSAGQPPKTILVTSSQPSEGKTTTAINTAFMLAQTGADVLIIDCDLRRPRLHAHFGIPNSKGLTNWLSGERDIDNLMQTYPAQPNLKLLTSGPVPPNPAELLGSDEMRKLLAVLTERFGHVVIDSPPAISFTDASILSTMVDGVVLVVHGGRSSRAVVRRAKQQLLDVGAHIFGVVLNNVKVETQDYYYSGYYSASEYDDADAPGGVAGEAR
ncbi:MAG: polysaccharide biosynthesis transport protein [Pyrinomonadaceae bacterium]|jgi:capsular exopolysaccharide synthesis family protein|nr:polysaccharide biosynthesis transport protein [Pyrinomonadaceae bacterium]MDQ1728483.1 polysaccharide biosynthesis transport protein [Pyrinomonadaceae bacterium]